MDKVGCEVICKSHSARSERDQYRICPTKLSKSDLEDLYFALLENNLQLKKTINGQQDRIKVLSTKMQRMISAQNVLCAEENKNCCVATKAVVNQQKDMIADLKRTNERMADRIRKLNMRLCSAKQFCKSATPRGLRCSTATSPYLIKHSPCSYKQQSHSTLKLAVSYHNLSRDTLVTKYVQTEPCDPAEPEEEKKSCEDNKCKTLMDDLKERIVELQEKLSSTQEEWSLRVRSAEGELQRVRGARAGGAHELRRARERGALLTSSLRAAEGTACELKMQLSIEKRRVVELETRLKAATISNRVSKSIEDTLTSIQESNKTSGVDVTLTCTCGSPRPKLESSSQQAYTGGLSPKGGNYCDATKLSKSTDDSGYTDTNKSQNSFDDQSLNKIIEELTKRIVVLQTQVDALTISPPEADNMKTIVDIVVTEDHNINTTTVKEDSTPNQKERNVNTHQTTHNQKHKEKIQLTDVETNFTGQEGITNVLSPTTNPDSNQSGIWERNTTKIKLITSKIKENDCKTNEQLEKSKENNEKTVEYLDSAKQNDDNIKNNISKVNENNEKSKEISNEKSIPIENKNQALNETSLTAEDKNSNKNVPEIDIINKNCRTVLKKEEFIQGVERDKKSGFQDKAAGENKIDSPKKLDKSIVLKYMHREKQDKARIRKSLMNTEQQPKLEKRRTLLRTDTVTQNVSSCEEATYTVEGETSDASSADNTDYEISSMTDLTEDREPKSPARSRLSPGERAPRDPRAPGGNYSLSEGEIPVTSVRRRSYDEKERAGTMTTAPKMEETLQAITDELARCKRLLHRTHDTATRGG